MAAQRAADIVLQGIPSRGHMLDGQWPGVDSDAPANVAVVLVDRTGHCRERVAAVGGSLTAVPGRGHVVETVQPVADVG